MSQAVKIGVLVLQEEESNDLREPELSSSYTSFYWWLTTLGGVQLDGIGYAVELVTVYSKLSTVDQQMDFLHSELGVDLVLGPSDDRAVEAVARAANRSGMLYIAAGPASEEVLSSSPLIFSVQPPPNTRLIPGLEAVGKAGALSVAVLYEDTPVNQEVCGTVQDFTRRKNMRIILERSLPEEGRETAFSSIVAFLQLSQVDVVVGCLGSNACESLLEISRSMNYNPQAFLFTECAVTLPARTELGSLGLFLVGSVPLMPDLDELRANTDRDSPAWRPWQAYRRATRQEERQNHVVRQTTFGLFTAYMLVLGVQASGSTMPAEVAAALSELDFDASGQLKNAGSEVVQSQMNHSLLAISNINKLRYPRPSWADLRCSNRADVEAERLGVDVETGICRPCTGGEAPHFPEDKSRSVCKSCPAGRHLEGVRENGISCVDCALGMFGARPGLEVCSMCPMGTFQDQTGQTACKLCRAGSYAQHEASDSCSVCLAIGGISSYADKHGSTSCKPCTTGSYCSPTSVTNADGYYRMDDGRAFRCIHGGGSACVQNHTCYAHRGQGETMEGFLCGVCRSGNSRSDPLDLCKPCMSLPSSVFWCLIAAALPHLQVMVICVAVVYTDFTKPKNQALIILKMTFNYVQMCWVVMPLITFFDKFDFPNPFVLNIGVMAFFDPPSAGPAFQCLTWRLAPSIKHHRVLLVLGLLWMPIWVLLPTTVYFIVWFVRRRHLKETRCLEKVVIFAVVSIYFIQPRVSTIFMSQLSCRSFDELRLVVDTNVLCESEEHTMWRGLSVLGLAIFSFGTPMCLGGLLFNLKHRGRLKDLQVLRMLGFLYAGLEPQCYYYECVLMIRKVMLPMAAVLPLQNGRIVRANEDSDESLYLCSVVALLFLTTVFLAVHMKLNPFDNRSYFILDRIEMLSLCSILTLLLAQTFGTIIHPEELVSLGLALLVIVVYAMFLGILIWGLFLRHFFKRFPTFMRTLQSCNSPWVTVQPDGFGSLRMHGTILNAFTCIFTEAISDHTEYMNYLSYHSLIHFIQRVCVTAHVLRMRKDKQTFARQASAFLKPMERLASKRLGSLHVAKQQIEDTLERGETRLRWLLGFGSSNSRNVDVPESAVTMQMLYGEMFTVEELHEAMVWCQRSLSQGQCARINGEPVSAVSARADSVSSETVDIPAGLPSGLELTEDEWQAIDIALGPEECYTSSRSEDGPPRISLSRDASTEFGRPPPSSSARALEELPSEARHFPTVPASPSQRSVGRMLGPPGEELPSAARHFPSGGSKERPPGRMLGPPGEELPSAARHFPTPSSPLSSRSGGSKERPPGRMLAAAGAAYSSEELPSEARHFPVASPLSPRSASKGTTSSRMMQNMAEYSGEELPSEARHFAGLAPRVSPGGASTGRLLQSLASYAGSEEALSVATSEPTVEDLPTPSAHTVASSRTETKTSSTSRSSRITSQRMLLSVNAGSAPRRPSSLEIARSSMDFIPWRSGRSRRGSQEESRA